MNQDPHYTLLQIVILILFGVILGIPIGWLFGRDSRRKPTNEADEAKHFSCHLCKREHVKADEDGCCSACGYDCEIETCHCPEEKKKRCV